MKRVICSRCAKVTMLGEHDTITRNGIEKVCGAMEKGRVCGGRLRYVRQHETDFDAAVSVGYKQVACRRR